MTNIQKVLTAAMVVLLLGAAGCFSSGNRQLDDQAAVDKVQIGKTRDEVRAAVGEPNSVTTMSSGEEVWIYVSMKSQATAATYIPVVGLFAGGSDGQSRTLHIMFSKEGVVKDVSKGQHTTKVRF